MRLYRCRLDMRACHPAEKSTEFLRKGVSTPHLPTFTEGKAILPVSGENAMTHIGAAPVLGAKISSELACEK